MNTNRNWWPAGIVLAFLLFFIGMASVVVIASTHREHLVNANYYEQELQFQGQIDAAARAHKSGAAVVYDSAGRNLILTLPAATFAGKFSGTVQFYRPSTPELDRELPLEPKTDGTQTVNVSALAPGPWWVRVKWIGAGENFFLEQKITIAGK